MGVAGPAAFFFLGEGLDVNALGDEVPAAERGGLESDTSSDWTRLRGGSSPSLLETTRLVKLVVVVVDVRMTDVFLGVL